MKPLIGSVEFCDLPDINVYDVEMHVDTGIYFSQLFVANIVEDTQEEQAWVSFDVYRDQYEQTTPIACNLPVIERRVIHEDFADEVERPVVQTKIIIKEQAFDIKLVLNASKGLRYTVLFGRKSLDTRFTIDPSQTHLQSF